MRWSRPSLIFVFLSLLCISQSLILQPTSVVAADDEKAAKRIVFLAGRPSHGYGSHEHLAGCRILAATIQQALPDVKCEVIPGGWPENDDVLDGASTIVMYADGGGGHPVIAHQAKMDALIEKGTGLVCIHYAVEVPTGEPGTNFLKWLGGYFETHWSVNPHWTAQYKTLPEHPITRGVPPFEANDEWYFHMRFQPDMKGVTPILSAVAPEETMNRGDGPHSGNPDVRKEVAQGIPQHMAWAYERPNGGRSFGFTGGHYHWNWGRPEILKLVSNAIVWTAHLDVPEKGISLAPPSVDQLKEGQDEPIPANFDAKGIRNEFKLTSTGTQENKPSRTRQAAVKPAFSSPVINGQTPGHAIKATVPLNGSKELHLVVNDGGDGFSCDWANWVDPVLVAGEKRVPLTDIAWTSASSQWGEVRKGKSAGGDELRVNGKTVSGIGTHANSLISFKLPEAFDRLEVTCAIDDGGANQNNAQSSSVRFLVFTQTPNDANLLNSSGGDSQRTPETAISGLDVHPQLEATLVAAEPELLSLTNLDVDDKGRIWVCEVVNYRRHNGKRPEGDRILILEDTDQDGISDKTKVFYQGPEVDSAMGICVLGNRVIVSASPNVWIFTDENGDDVPEKKELFFTKTGQPQHDHSAHSFVFGPDGKLYWNFGNTGQSVHDAQGNVVKDLAGNEVVDNGKPYYGGMVFRCDPDGSNFEVLGHNFRNNYEAAVDSFGTIWQSDNDDDGNRATRINYVMEYGNFGYRDELTGAGWQAERTGWESEIPNRHWHLNDPGVVPTMLITGAGSPTGITVYEGRLLPEIFWDQPLHCDAGPNVVRAYPTKVSGAGYSAEIVNMLVGERDKWFRPADVCVAPDGSVFVTDWYDPGVGGHNMQDLERGRLFRLAPPGAKYSVPKYDYSKMDDALEALKNPNQSVRFMAWQALHAMGEQAESGLKKLWNDPNPRVRARALWLLGKIPGRAKRYIELAIADPDANIRITAIRLARQSGLALDEYFPSLLKDASPAVRRELAIALHLDKSPSMPSYWAQLAMQYDGKDRWYLEALGIAAQHRWNEAFDAWLALAGDRWNSAEGRQIVWRSRAEKSASYMIKLLAEPTVAEEEIAQIFRALDYQNSDKRTEALRSLLDLSYREEDQANTSKRDRILVEALLRLPDVKLADNPKLQTVVARYLENLKDDSQILKVVKQLNPTDSEARLLKLVSNRDVDSLSVQAVEFSLERFPNGLVASAAKGADGLDLSRRIVQAIGLSNRGEAMELLQAVIQDPKTETAVRSDAAIGLARSEPGQRRILAMVERNSLPAEVRLLVAGPLRSSPNGEIKAKAEGIFPATMSKDQKPFPSVDQLSKRKGNPEKGKELFTTVGTCANCHQVGGQGKNVGPDLTEIGTKLSREAMYVSILDPSAGISHNFETYAVQTESGEVATGLLVSQTDDAVAIKDAQGIERKYDRSEVAEFKKQEKSLMPENLHHLVSEEGLVDVVEYLATLKKK